MKGLKMGKVFPKMRIMPNMSKLTGVKKSDVGLPSFKPKRRKTSISKMLRDI